jgi:hypothetical protein
MSKKSQKPRPARLEPAPPVAERVPLFRPTLRGIVLWVVAFALAAGAMIYQRATGPTYPLKRTFTVAGKSYKYEFLRSYETTGGAPVQIVLPRTAPHIKAVLHWRRFPTQDSFVPIPMAETIVGTAKAGESMKREVHHEAHLPRQPAAGKVEYYVTAESQNDTQRLPPGEDTVVLRYKDPVPDYILIPHVTAMILVIIVGMRAGLSALFQPGTTRRYAWVALTLMTIGGMTLGPLVQKYAFGEYWTGFPNGGDWTDNKMLFMWLAWLIACVVLGASTRPVTSIGRAATVIAALVMTGVYMIPHSMGGSQLDYSAVEKGVDPQEAIRTGRQ